MYLITATTDNVNTVIHEPGTSQVKLADAKISREVNKADSLTATMYAENPGFYALKPFATKVTVVNTMTGKTQFEGRVINISPEMDSDGTVTKVVTCEGLLGYLNDSLQNFVEEKHYDTLTGFVNTLLNLHNSKVENYKKIYAGNITLQTFETSSGVTKQIDRASTWENLQKKLLESFDGEMQVRRGGDGKLYLDYAKTLGETRATRIQLGYNMQDASREVDFNSAITRLYVYGAKLKETVEDENGQEVEQETEERLTIASVNNGKEYLDDAVGIEEYGIIEGYVEFDDVTQVQNLLTKGQQYLGQLTALPVSHSMTALDLSYLGLDYDDFALHDSYPCYNPLIDLDETLEIVGQTIDLNEPLNSSIDLGDSAFRLSADIDNGDLSQDFEDFKDQTATNIVNINNKTVANSASIKVFNDKIEQTVTEKTEQIITEQVGNVVKSSKNQYYLSTSATAPTGGSWTDSRPSGAGYLWVRLVETLLDGSVVNGTPYCVTTDPGREVTGVLTEYYRSTSSTTQTGGSWSSDFPSYVSGTYLWVRTKVSYTNPTGTETTAPVLDSTWSQLNSIQNTINKMPKTTVTQYYLSTSNTTQTGGSWGTTVPTGTGYLWMRIVTTLQDGSTVTNTPVCITQDASKTVSSVVTEYYRSTSKTAQTGGSWTTTPPAYLAGTYLWIRTKITYENPASTETTTPVLDSTWAELSNLDDKIGSTADDLAGMVDSVDDKTNSNGESIADIYDQLTGILQQVSETITKVTQLEQTADGWNFNWTTITETVTNIAGQVNTTYSEQLKYIKFVDGEIWLGRDPDPGQDDYKVVISNERIRFLVNNVETAYISSGKLYIYDAEIINRLDIGEFAFYPRDNGNLTLRYVG